MFEDYLKTDSNMPRTEVRFTDVNDSSVKVLFNFEIKAT